MTSDDLKQLVVPAEHQVFCARCGMGVVAVFSRSGSHIRADCPECGRYVKFIKQVAEHPFEEEPELYEEELPW